MADQFSQLYEQVKKATEDLFVAAGNDRENQKKAIGQAILVYRTGHRITQQDLAEKLGVTKMEIIRWEGARNMPSQLAIAKIKELGIIKE